MRNPRDNLILASSELMRSDTGRRFFEALSVQVEESREQLVFAPPEHLAYAQGVARQGTVLLKLMKNADAEAAKIIQAEEAVAQRSKP